ncbi:hypothetical protein FBEOM_4305 [Fusarium beomiforme]|uniref:NACHT-NTPase and P-loop NTPases N-terminal domain-containing protein n=1 Tax=Fusarium beomiforme TaxID=44412 RepID=A0A9P5AMZ1_9HYPO|nr:hypothetical protein FBEOM_4305 [Fusarium beomiforme]
MDQIIQYIKNTNVLLQTAEEDYGKVNDDVNLSPGFRAAGNGLAIVRTNLDELKPILQGGNSTGDITSAFKSIWVCKDNARVLSEIFRIIARSPEGQRSDRYAEWVHNQHPKVDELVRDTMKLIGDLAEQAGVAQNFAPQLMCLNFEIESLEKLVSKKSEDKDTGGISHSGVGHVFSSRDRATQNNNTGPGDQYTGSFGEVPHNRTSEKSPTTGRKPRIGFEVHG